MDTIPTPDSQNNSQLPTMPSQDQTIQKSSSSSKRILITAAIVILLIAGGVGVFVLGTKFSQSNKSQENIVQKITPRPPDQISANPTINVSQPPMSVSTNAYVLFRNILINKTFLVHQDGTGLVEVAQGYGSPKLSPDTQRLAYVDGSNNLKIMKSGDAKQDLPMITGNQASGIDNNIYWSPNNNYVVYTKNNEVVLMNANGNLIQTMSIPQGEILWKSDSSQFAIYYMKTPLQGEGDFEPVTVIVCDTQGNQKANYTLSSPDQTGFHVFWSANTNLVYYTHSTNGIGTYSLISSTIDGMGVKLLSGSNGNTNSSFPNSAIWGAQSVNVSPDGTTFLTSRQDYTVTNNSEVWTMAVDGTASKPTLIPNTYKNINNAMWLPDGKHIYLTVYDGRIYKVYVTDLSQGNLQLVYSYPS